MGTWGAAGLEVWTRDAEADQFFFEFHAGVNHWGLGSCPVIVWICALHNSAWNWKAARRPMVERKSTGPKNDHKKQKHVKNHYQNHYQNMVFLFGAS